MMFMANISFLMTQEIPSLVPSLPTSPQAETFKRYGTFSINYSTGVPDISIPLFEINHHGYSLPLELKYYPQPLKQGYNYDVVGHGWNLSINSCISRSIEHCADEEKNFIVEEPTGYYKDCGDCFKEFNYAHDLFNAILPDGSSFDFIIDNINGSLNLPRQMEGRSKCRAITLPLIYPLSLSPMKMASNIHSVKVIYMDQPSYTIITLSPGRCQG